MTSRTPPAIRRELGDFLRTRRERLTPHQVGLPPTGRRRTPGLRREEVAVIAGVGVTWYTWLEQGRPINVSAQVLDALARALRLDDAESRHLRRLAGLQAPSAAAGCAPPLAAAFQPVLDKLDPYPAALQTPSFDMVAYNHAYRLLFTDLDLIPPERRNCAVQFFTDPDWRSRYVDDDVVADRMVAQLRSAIGTDLHTPAAARTVEELRAGSEEFAQLWRQHDILADDHETKRLHSPAVGLLHLDFVTTQVAATGHRLVVMTPADETTSRRLARLGDLAVAT